MTADDADGTDKKERERMAAGMALSRPSDVARPPQRLPHPRNPRNPRSLLCWVTRRASFLGSACRTSAFRLRGGERGPAEHAEGRRTRLRLGAHRLRSPRGGPLDELSFAAAVSRSLGDAATPNPLRQRRGLDVLGTGDRGWRPGGLTPGYCLKPFQGFEDGLGKGHRRRSRIDDELRSHCGSGWGLGRLVPEGVGFEGVGGVETRRLQPRSHCGSGWAGTSRPRRIGAGTSRPRGCWFRRRGRCGDETSPPPRSH